MHAASKSHLDIVQLFLEYEGIIRIDIGDFNKSIFILAIINGQTEIVKIYIKQKGIYSLNQYRNAALILASLNGSIDIVKLLLVQKGIDVNAKTATYFIDLKYQNNIWKLLILFKTALMLAYEFGHIVIVKLLLEQKGIINIVDNNGKKFTNELDSKDEINTLPKIRDENNQRDNFIPGHCTFEQAGYKFVQHNRLYTCKTCMKNSRNNLCFCEECAKVCHKGHDVRVKSTRQQGFCDCGAGYFLHPCKLNPKHHEVNEE